LLYIFGDSRNKIALAAIVVAIIFLKHRDNIRRLVHGKENKLKL
jgi:glycerol-3-phosphate acyltransferase PlsY